MICPKTSQQIRGGAGLGRAATAADCPVLGLTANPPFLSPEQLRSCVLSPLGKGCCSVSAQLGVKQPLSLSHGLLPPSAILDRAWASWAGHAALLGGLTSTPCSQVLVI